MKSGAEKASHAEGTKVAKWYDWQRLRVLDFNTPWFWFTIFYEPLAYGDPWLRVELWEPHKWRRWWLHFWHWEAIPETHNGWTSEPIPKREQDV